MNDFSMNSGRKVITTLSAISSCSDSVLDSLELFGCFTSQTVDNHSTTCHTHYPKIQKLKISDRQPNIPFRLFTTILSQFIRTTIFLLLPQTMSILILLLSIYPISIALAFFPIFLMVWIFNHLHMTSRIIFFNKEKVTANWGMALSASRCHRISNILSAFSFLLPISSLLFPLCDNKVLQQNRMPSIRPPSRSSRIIRGIIRNNRR
mmetsp:Transcript_30939/g.42589  ORF Transcript_30939/g.42589 Transcript_30939/m.42589 type:complete len:207 (-) Transcript_30939:1387-2007(-)